MGGGAVVLCGGRSSRMGRPKALLPWGGRPMIDHVVGVLRQAVEDVVVVSSADLELPPLEARVVRDREPALGPLAGIREGLAASTAELVFVTSTDAPFLTARFVRTMLSFGRAAAPVVDGFVQSMSAVYPASAAALADGLIAAGRLRPLFLLEAAGYRAVRPEELTDPASMRSLNTPEDYLAALRDAGMEGAVTVELLGVARARTGVGVLEAPVGRLADVLRGLEERVPALRGVVSTDGVLAEHCLASLNGLQFTRDAGVAVGPGDRVLVMDAAAGG